MFSTIIIVFTVVGWLLPSVLVSWVASQRGRGGAAWFFVSFFFSPLAALLALIATPRLHKPSQTIESLPEKETEEDAARAPGDEEKDTERMTEEEERAASIALERAVWGWDEPKENPPNSPRKGGR